MAINNHERVGKAMELVKAGVGPCVEREFGNVYQEKALSEALAYNALVQSWPEFVRLAGESASRGAELTQATLI